MSDKLFSGEITLRKDYTSETFSGTKCFPLDEIKYYRRFLRRLSTIHFSWVTLYFSI